MADKRHIKGVDIIDLVRNLRVLDKAGKLPELPPNEARYLNDRILVSSWYPHEDFLALLRRIHAALGGSDEAAESMGVFGANTGLTGVHKIFIREGDPEGTVRRLAGIWANQFDFGKADIEIRDGEAIIVISEYGDISRLHGVVTLGWMRQAVVLAGGDPKRVRIVAAPWKGGDRLEIALLPVEARPPGHD